MPKPSRKIFLVLLMVLAAGVGAYLFYDGEVFRSRFSPDEFQRLLDERTVALARLENLETTEADQAWRGLAQELPQQLMPVRNLAITRLLSLDQEEEVDVEPVKEAFAAMVTRENQSPAALWLYARLVMHEKISPPSAARDLKAQELLSLAAEQSPDDVRFWYHIFEIGRNSFDESAQAAGVAALEKAWELQPDNLHILIHRLLTQAESQDPAIAKTLEIARETFGPLEAIVQRGSRRSVADLLGKAEEALQNGDWNLVTRYVKQLRNVVQVEEIAKWDFSLITAHPLDFAVTDYDPSFYDQRPSQANVERPASIEVVFEPSSATFPSEARGAKALEILDFDLDGTVEVAALTDDRFLVLGSRDEQWQTLLSVDLPSGMRGMVLADLDRDRPITSMDGQQDGQQGEAADRNSEDVVQIEPDQTPPSKVCHEADLDLVIYGDAGVMVFRNQSTPGQCSVELVPQAEGLNEIKNVVCAVMADIDHDADVDLLISTNSGVRVWSLGGATLQYDDLTRWTLGPPENVQVAAMAIVDWERDIDIDVVCSDASGKNLGLLENLRHGRFAWRPFEARDLNQSLQGGSALAILDNDGNRSWDLVSGNQRGLFHLKTSLVPSGKVVWQSQKQFAIETRQVAGIRLIDYDNDYYRDILMFQDTRLQCYRGRANDFDPKTEVVAAVNEAIASEVTALAVGDLDRDGDQDCVVATESKVIEVVNSGGNKNHWLAVHAMGRDDNKGRANHTGIGSLVEVRSGDRYQAQVVTGQTTHFGLGLEQQPATMRIVWTNGVPQAVVRPPSDLTLCERMILKGSCPYVYTWTGERFEFFTDCLWAAPIGLQLADGVVAPSRPWEYLRIPGERLQPRDGRYAIQITEELWEAAYFDEVELIAVDHPAGVDIFSNEKVGPPAIAEYGIHTVTNPRLPVAASDQRKRDVLPWLREKDGRYLKAFDRQHWQGLTEPHLIELDLGELDEPRKITLFLTGWIYPSDTSLNVGFSQDKSLPSPQMPSLWAPDGKGGWREVQAYMGFPGGKTKTIAVDVSEAFINEDFRLQIRTTSEIYWDYVFFTVDEPEVEVKTTRISPVSADLHFRGFSARRWVRRNAPEAFDYSQVGTEPVWPPMKGRFTRYGDVATLLQAADDQMVVMGAGDEMTVEFDVPPLPPSGWERDFLLHSVGWDKDADLNTYHGQSSEPLPFQAMQSYPFTADDQPPTSTGHQDYLRKYQTRRQNAAPFWRQLPKPGLH